MLRCEYGDCDNPATVVVCFADVGIRRPYCDAHAHEVEQQTNPA